AKVPDLIWPEAEPCVEGRMLETNFGEVPRLWARRERGIFHFGGVIKLTKSPGHRNTAGVTWSPNHWIELVLRFWLKPVHEIQRRRGCDLVTNGSNVFVNQRPVDEWIFP